MPRYVRKEPKGLHKESGSVTGGTWDCGTVTLTTLCPGWSSFLFYLHLTVVSIGWWLENMK